MAGKFEVYQDKGGQYRFRLKAGNGQTVATGESYPTKAACLKGVEAVKRAADGAALVDQTA
ncbi:YegP family protein [Nocardioides cheoyonin]|uniref:YegP family protein n=1 Tax=Nocardioides cheoyonin TaxID=3156615 RepID=UPI0032B3AA7E